MAAAIEVEEKLKDITDCPICLETYKEPKILPCIHTFCMHCLRETGEKLNKNPGDMMSCPVCRKEFTVPDTGFGGLQKNFFMDKLTEIKNILQPSSARNSCDACSEDNESLVEADIPSAEMYCIECHQRLCSECYKHHRKNKLTKNHRIIAIDGFKSEDRPMQETLKTDSCEKHKNSLLEIYCSGCEEVVCAFCLVENHQGHVGSDIYKVATEFRKQIEINVAEFSSLLPQLRQEEQGLDTYKTELMRCTEEIKTKINGRRQELKNLVDKHAESLLLALDSRRQQNLKKCELTKEDIETLVVCLESYKAYCLQLATIGSASDICRAKTALDARTKELKHLHVSSVSSTYSSHISPKLRDLQDCVRSSEQNIVGELEEHQAENLDGTKDDCIERSPVAKADNLHEGNLEKPIKNTSQQLQEDEEDAEDSEEFLECLEWNMDACHVMHSIEFECLSELELMLKSKVKEMGTSESSIDDKLKELRQKITSKMVTIESLNYELENERVHLKEVEKERCMLADRTKDHESNEQRLNKMVEDLKSQVVLLNDLVYGGKKQTKTTKGCDGGVTFSMTLERLSNNTFGFEVFGIAILENELFVVSNDNVTAIYDLPTLKFKRRWKVPRKGTYDDIKECNVNKCLYMMKVDSGTYNEIIRMEPSGSEIAAWSVDKARGQLSITSESNVLLTVSSLNQLHEYTPNGKVDQVIDIPWNSGIEKPSHAIKLTSDHFLICHGNDEGPLVRVCIMERGGTVLKYFGELWKRSQLRYPIYLDRDGTGNILVVDHLESRVLLLSSDLQFKRILITHDSRYPDKYTESNPKKVCFDKSNGRVLMVEHVIKYYIYFGEKKIKENYNDTVSVFKL